MGVDPVQQAWLLGVGQCLHFTAHAHYAVTWQGRTIFPSLNKASSCVTGSKPSEGMPTMTIKHQGWRRRRKKNSHKNNNERNQRHIRKKKNSDPSTVAAGSSGHPAAAESSDHLKPLSPAHTHHMQLASVGKAGASKWQVGTVLKLASIREQFSNWHQY